jgi:hypothetical protein
MRSSSSQASRKALQKVFATASARRAARRQFVQTLHAILKVRLERQPLLLLRLDRRGSRRVPHQ